MNALPPAGFATAQPTSALAPGVTARVMRVSEWAPLEVEKTDQNAKYLAKKALKSGHFLE